MIMNFIYQNELRDSQIQVWRIEKIGICEGNYDKVFE